MEYIFPRISIVLYSGIGTIILGLLLLLGISWGKKSPLNYIFGSIVCIIVGIFLIYGSNGGSLKIDNGKVYLKIPMFSQRSFSFSEISNMQIVDLGSDSPYLPVKKKSGASFKNFRSGWFQLKNGERAFLLLQGQKGIYIKTTNGDAYLIGIKNFDLLVDKFKQNMKNNSLQN